MVRLPGGERMNVDIEYTTSIPHGGTLVDRRTPEDEREERKRRAEELPKAALGPRTLSDLEIVATLVVEDRYSYDKEREALEVYRTTDREHPGVAALHRQGDALLGGEVTLLVEEPNPRPFPGYYHEPHELRKLLAEKNWRKVVGFQTRNPVHRAHEYIQKSALETVDGLLLNPLVGETKSDDISAAVRMKS